MRASTVFFCLAGAWSCTTRVSGRPALGDVTGVESEAEAEAESEAEAEAESNAVEADAGAGTAFADGADSGLRQLKPDAAAESEPTTAFEPAPDAAGPNPDAEPVHFDLGEPDAGTDAARTDAGADAAVLLPDAPYQPCPESMHLVGDALCFEPAGDVSAVAWTDADAACRDRSLRLCTREERRLACAELGAEAVCAGLASDTGSWEWSATSCDGDVGGAAPYQGHWRSPCCNDPAFGGCQRNESPTGGYHCCAGAD